MRVLLATNLGEPIGGIAISYRTLLGSSYSQQLEVHVVETSQGTLSFSQRGGWQLRNWLNGLVNVFAFVRALRRSRPDLVHIGSSYRASFLKHSLMVLLAHWMGYLVVIEMHCTITQFLPVRPSLWRRYILFVFQHVCAIVTLSHEWDTLQTLLPHIRVRRIPNAIKLEPYQALPRPSLHRSAQVQILFMGHIGREKGCFDLLEVVDQLRQRIKLPFCLHLVGETLLHGEKEALQELVTVRGLQAWVQIHPPAYEQAKLKHFADSDLLVLPSHHEGMPMVVIEAMAAGLAVVATKVGGIPEQVVAGETGLLVEPGDALALGQALQSMIEHPAQRLAMGLAGRARALALFDIEIRAARLIALYHEVVQDRCAH